MLAIIIPVYNEEEILRDNVHRLHEYLNQCHIEHEIVISNNGSSDRTLDIANELAATNSWVKAVNTENRGVGVAFALGVKSTEAEFVVCLDADLSSDLVFLKYANNLLHYADMVVGSKAMGKQRRSVARVFGSHLYIFFAQFVFNLAVSDFSVGSKAYKRESIISAMPFIDAWTGFTIELCLFLEAHNKRIVQIGIDCDDKRKSRFSLLHEGFYRYYHIYRCWQLRKTKTSWLYN